MRHVRFSDPAGAVRHGEWLDDGVAFVDQEYELDEVDLLPPCELTKLVCIGLNYADQRPSRTARSPIARCSR